MVGQIARCENSMRNFATSAFVIIALSAHALARSSPTALPSPVLQNPSVTTAGAVGPAAIADSNNREFDASYDPAGRLVALKAKHGPNMHDMYVTYRSDGLVSSVRFQNKYRIFVRYDPKGRQEITDSFGDTLIRVNSGSGQYTVQTAMDPRGVLTHNLQQLSSLLVLFPTTPALSTLPPSAVAP